MKAEVKAMRSELRAMKSKLKADQAEVKVMKSDLELTSPNRSYEVRITATKSQTQLLSPKTQLTKAELTAELAGIPARNSRCNP